MLKVFKKPLILALLLLAIIPPTIVFAQIKHEEIVEQQSDKSDLNVYQYVKEVIRGAASGVGDQIVPSKLADGSYNNYGAVPALTGGIGFLASTPPVETSTYIADVLQNSGLVQPAYAQGVGFSALTPVLQLWKVFRNLAYFLFIIVFVVIGFMIMFRAQVDHQTIVTVQMALPKLVITLILITFSYAIAGLVVDLLYLLIFFIIALFAQAGIVTDADTLRGALLGRSILRIAFDYLITPGDTAGAAANSISAVTRGFIRMDAPILGGIVDWLMDSIAYLVIAVAILIATFRTFFVLLMAYVGIILSTIFAPIQLMLNAIPGQNTFGPWLRGLVANALIFPAIAVMIILGIYLAGGNTTDAGIARTGVGSAVGGQGAGGFGLYEGTGFVPPFITTRDRTYDSMQSDNGVPYGLEHVKALIGLGMIMLLPEIAKMVKKALGVEDAGFGEAFGAGLKGGAGALGGAIKAPFQLGSNALVYGRYAAEGLEVVNRFKRGKGLRSFLIPPDYGESVRRPEKTVDEIQTETTTAPPEEPGEFRV